MNHLADFIANAGSKIPETEEEGNELAFFQNVALNLLRQHCVSSLLGLCREACGGKHSGLHLDVVVRVQTLANGVVGIFPLRDDGGQTAEHPEKTRAKNLPLTHFKLESGTALLMLYHCSNNRFQ